MERAKRVTQITFAILSSGKISSILGLEKGVPLLVVKRIYFSIRDRVLGVAVTYTPGDKHRFKINFERVNS